MKVIYDIRIDFQSTPRLWIAYREGWEPGGQYGLGKTPAEAPRAHAGTGDGCRGAALVLRVWSRDSGELPVEGTAGTMHRAVVAVTDRVQGHSSASALSHADSPIPAFLAFSLYERFSAAVQRKWTCFEARSLAGLGGAPLRGFFMARLYRYTNNLQSLLGHALMSTHLRSDK